MKLNQVKPNIEMSDDMEGTLFSIGDEALVLDILRSRMYSNPIGSICREISANAKDSHIEAGKPDEPIQITLPSTLDPNFRVRDFGVGLSPKRIETVYSKFGTSTKRDDNKQVGAFGMGAKTPWSYSSDFSVISICDKVKYHYTCIIDESKLGKIVKLNEEKTTESNGVEVIIPVKSSDFNAFKDATELACRHWSVPPTIKGSKFQFKKPTFTLSGKGWGIDKSRGYHTGEVKLIISQVEYPLNMSDFKSPSAKVLNAVSGTTYLYFDTGELSLSATREQVHLDKPTTEKIAAKLDEITQSFKDEVQIKIDKCANLFDAQVYKEEELYDTFSDPSFLGTLQWQGIDLVASSYITPKATEIDGHEFSSSSRYNSYDKLKPADLYRRSNRTVYFAVGTKLVLNDTAKEPLAKQVVQLFRKDEDLTRVVVISRKGKTTWKSLDKKYHLDKMGALKLSQVPEYKDIPVPPPVVKKPRLLISKYDATKKAFKRVSYETMEADTDKKVLCLLQKNWNPHQIVLSASKLLNDYDLASFVSKISGFSLYGIDSLTPKDRIKEDLEGFQTINKFLEEHILDAKKVSYEEIKYAEQKRYYHNRYDIDFPIKELRKKIADPQSAFLKVSSMQTYLSDLAKEQAGQVRMYENLKGAISDTAISKWLKANPQKDIVSLDKEVKKTYPMLSHIGYSYGTELKEAMTHYVNLIDAGLKKKTATKKTTQKPATKKAAAISKGDTSI